MPKFSQSDAYVTPSSQQPMFHVESKKSQTKPPERMRRQDFSDEEAMDLYNRGDEIMKVAPDNIQHAWEAWASKSDVSVGNLID